MVTYLSPIRKTEAGSASHPPPTPARLVSSHPREVLISSPCLAHASPTEEKKTSASLHQDPAKQSQYLSWIPTSALVELWTETLEFRSPGPWGHLVLLAFLLDGKNRLPLNPFPKYFSTRPCLTKPSLQDRKAHTSTEIRVLWTLSLSLHFIKCRYKR